MKKIMFLVLLTLLISGCQNKQVITKVEKFDYDLLETSLVAPQNNNNNINGFNSNYKIVNSDTKCREDIKVDGNSKNITYYVDSKVESKKFLINTEVYAKINNKCNLVYRFDDLSTSKEPVVFNDSLYMNVMAKINNDYISGIVKINKYGLKVIDNYKYALVVKSMFSSDDYLYYIRPLETKDDMLMSLDVYDKNDSQVNSVLLNEKNYQFLFAANDSIYAVHPNDAEGVSNYVIDVYDLNGNIEDIVNQKYVKQIHINDVQLDFRTIETDQDNNIIIYGSQPLICDSTFTKCTVFKDSILPLDSKYILAYINDGYYLVDLEAKRKELINEETLLATNTGISNNEFKIGTVYKNKLYLLSYKIKK